MTFLLLSLIMSLILKKHIRMKTLKLVSITCFAMVLILFEYYSSSSLATQKGYRDIESFLFFTYFVSTLVIIVLILEEFISKHFLLGVIFYASLLYSGIKLVATVCAALGFISMASISDFVLLSFGVQPMLFPITEYFSRLQLANDYIICFCLFFTIVRPDLFSFTSKKFFVIGMLLLFICVIISFSRFMLLLLLCSLILKLIRIKSISVSGFIAFVFFILLVTSLYYVNFEQVNNAIELRFSSSGVNQHSDATRDFQVTCLSKSIDKSPFLGVGGFGDYSVLCPGPINAEFSYEVQYLGFIYRFGFIPTLLFMLIYFFQFSMSIEGWLFSKYNIPSFIAMLTWMMVGFFNPYLISAFASVIVALCMSCSGGYKLIKKPFDLS
ncbi:hypothetical protein ABW11_07395 [Pluralibacter gergoviae]|nr:hypothetical protein ABW11_07395 [Pluralibacter gergoviae]